MDSSAPVYKAKCQHLNDVRHVNSCKRLCDLPDAILLQILAFLPTEDVVRTSVLSRRWEFLWTSIPNLVFREEQEENNRRRMLFRNFVERALLLRDSSSMKAFSLSCKADSAEYFDGYEFRVNTWITAAIRHNVEDLCLYLELSRHTVYMLPCCIFTCGTLRELHLEMEHDLKLPSSVYLQNLKVLTLVEVRFGVDKSVEKLLSCPSLEKLSLDICDWNLEVLEISAPNLLHLTITEYCHIRNSQVQIHGTFIKSFYYCGDFNCDYVILNSPSIVEFSIRTNSYRRGTYRLCKLMKDFCNLKQLTFSCNGFEDMDAGENIFNSFPVLHNLTELELLVPDVRLESKALSLLLCKCPILTRLTFSAGLLMDDETDDGILDPIPPCFASSLKEIAICGFYWTDCQALAATGLISAAALLDKVLFSRSSLQREWQGRLMPHSDKLPGASDRHPASSKHDHWDHIYERKPHR